MNGRKLADPRSAAMQIITAQIVCSPLVRLNRCVRGSVRSPGQACKSLNLPAARMSNQLFLVDGFWGKPWLNTCVRECVCPSSLKKWAFAIVCTLKYGERIAQTWLKTRACLFLIGNILSLCDVCAAKRHNYSNHKITSCLIQHNRCIYHSLSQKANDNDSRAQR